MRRQRIVLSLIVWSMVVVALFVVFNLWPGIQPGPVENFLILVAVGVGMVVARPALKRVPPEKRITISSRKTASFQKYLAPAGVAAIATSLVLAVALGRMVHNSPVGVVILFVPSFALGLLGVAAIVFRVFIWFFGD